MNTIRAVLFDLDGTLLDTVPDLVYALNRLRTENNLPEMPLAEIKPIVSLGSRAMVKQALGINETDSRFNTLREHFLALYDNHLADSTRFFPDIEKVLEHLDENGLPWGIVTNKMTRHTLALLKALRFDHRPGCIICGDSLPTYKPDPEPIRYACELLKQTPDHCLYVGDAATDVMASKAAGARSLVALYGYIHAHEDPFSWHADGYIQNPMEIIDWLSKF
ncbi:Phosphoglycolate phosphatase [Aquicella siphonis]|uniref:Phosphoglycolate phosphatase n=1 Tax=Aquicella siphonis TaxID=254247 RepID=A0A5E4PIC2_9COXI|nr:HAD-IA family hydrolase [Aquicella siphonis]VVC76101.1 Phosphoglycolate phosphatase [Aquicella siphonis]